jgi:hypothetical protein
MTIFTPSTQEQPIQTLVRVRKADLSIPDAPVVVRIQLR